MATVFGSRAELRRIEHLAGRVPAGYWVVAPEDPGAEVAAAAARATTAPVLSISTGSPLSAIGRLAREGGRQRVHLRATGGADEAARWSAPVALLCLPSASPRAATLFHAWARHVPRGGHAVFYGGPGPRPESLRLTPGYWFLHVREGRLFLLTRRPYG